MNGRPSRTSRRIARTLALLLAFPSCHRPLAAAATGDCVSVSSWSAFKSIVRNAAASSQPGNLTFCGFVLTKPVNDYLVIDTPTTLACQTSKGCVLKGSGTHVVVRGPRARFTVSDFVFQGATAGAIRISGTGSSEFKHTFRNCDFLLNQNPADGGGGAIVVTPSRARLDVLDCDFYKNVGDRGGAIQFAGKALGVKRCNLAHNAARIAGGAVWVSSSTLRVQLVDSDFYDNADTNRRGDARYNSPAVHAGGTAEQVVVRDTRGHRNADCNGVYVGGGAGRGQQQLCVPFDRTSFRLGTLNLEYQGVQFSQGLVGEIIAKTGQPVIYTSQTARGDRSSRDFHVHPDGAAIVPLNDDGYVYVSNSETDQSEGGGVYGVEFDKHGNVRNYRKLMSGEWLCSGGLTPWNTWVGCEELPGGQCWQVHPEGKRPPEKTVIGGREGGQFESFTSDDRDPDNMAFFVSEDKSNGPIYRYRPKRNTPVGWDMLHGSGTVDYLQFHSGRKFSWTSSIAKGRQSADEYYWNVEGVLCHDGKLMFVSKVQQELFILDLDRGTYTKESTDAQSLPGGGSFGAQPDQLIRDTDGLMFFTEDGGYHPGVFAYNGDKYKALAQALDDRFDSDETTGVALSPDGKWLYFCYQHIGYLFRVRRLDGQPFEGQHVMRWKYPLGSNESRRRNVE